MHSSSQTQKEHAYVEDVFFAKMSQKNGFAGCIPLHGGAISNEVDGLERKKMQKHHMEETTCGPQPRRTQGRRQHYDLRWDPMQWKKCEQSLKKFAKSTLDGEGEGRGVDTLREEGKKRRKVGERKGQ